MKRDKICTADKLGIKLLLCLFNAVGSSFYLFFKYGNGIPEMIIKETNGLTMDRKAQIDKIRYRIDNLVTECSFVMQADFFIGNG